MTAQLAAGPDISFHEEHREQRAESREQRAESREQRAESREQRAESREQRAEGREQRAEQRARWGNASSVLPQCQASHLEPLVYKD